MFLLCSVLCFSANGTVSSISGTAVAKDPSEPAKLLVSFFEGNNPKYKTHPVWKTAQLKSFGFHINAYVYIIM